MVWKVSLYPEEIGSVIKSLPTPFFPFKNTNIIHIKKKNLANLFSLFNNWWRWNLGFKTHSSNIKEKHFLTAQPNQTRRNQDYFTHHGKTKNRSSSHPSFQTFLQSQTRTKIISPTKSHFRPLSDLQAAHRFYFNRDPPDRRWSGLVSPCSPSLGPSLPPMMVLSLSLGYVRMSLKPSRFFVFSLGSTTMAKPNSIRPTPSTFNGTATWSSHFLSLLILFLSLFCIETCSLKASILLIEFLFLSMLLTWGWRDGGWVWF